MENMYRVIRTSEEIRNKAEIVEGCTGGCETPEAVSGIFETREAAMVELMKYESSICELSGALGAYYLVTEYFIEAVEVEVDEDAGVVEVVASLELYDCTVLEHDK